MINTFSTLSSISRSFVEDRTNCTCHDKQINCEIIHFFFLHSSSPSAFTLGVCVLASSGPRGLASQMMSFDFIKSKCQRNGKGFEKWVELLRHCDTNDVDAVETKTSMSVYTINFYFIKYISSGRQKSKTKHTVKLLLVSGRFARKILNRRAMLHQRKKNFLLKHHHVDNKQICAVARFTAFLRSRISYTRNGRSKFRRCYIRIEKRCVRRAGTTGMRAHCIFGQKYNISLSFPFVLTSLVPRFYNAFESQHYYYYSRLRPV